MSSAVTGSEPAPNSTLGNRLREARLASRMSVREMGRRVNVSPSFISQIELGRAAPSIGTLYAIASELNLSLDSLMNTGEGGENGSPVAEATAAGAGEADPIMALPSQALPSKPRAVAIAPHEVRSSSGHQRAGDRPSIKLRHVTWQRLTADDDPNVEFLRITYPPGSESCPADNLMNHNGWEYGHVLSGALDVQLSFQSVTLETGDSIDFDSSRPHRLSNPHDEPCVAIWVVVGRQHRG